MIHNPDSQPGADTCADAPEQPVLTENIFQNPKGIMQAYVADAAGDPRLKSVLQNRLNHSEPPAGYFDALHDIAQSVLGIVPPNRSDDMRSIAKVPYVPNPLTEQAMAAAVIFEFKYYLDSGRIHDLAFASQEWEGVVGKCVQHYLRSMPLEMLIGRVFEAEEIDFSHIAHVVALACESADPGRFADLYAVFHSLVDEKIDVKELKPSNFFFFVHTVPPAAMRCILQYLEKERPDYFQELFLYMQQMQNLEAEMPSDETEFGLWRLMHARTPHDHVLLINRRHMGRAANRCLGPVARKEDKKDAWVKRVTGVVREACRAGIRHAVLRGIADTCTDTVKIAEGPDTAAILERENGTDNSGPMKIVLGTHPSLQAVHELAAGVRASVERYPNEPSVDSEEYVHVLRSLAVLLLSNDIAFKEAMELLMEHADNLTGAETLRTDWRSATMERKLQILNEMDFLSKMMSDACNSIIPRMVLAESVMRVKKRQTADSLTSKSFWRRISRLQTLDAREKFHQALELLLLEPERSLVAALVAQGWRHLTGARQVSDRRWCEKVVAYRQNELEGLGENGQSAEYARVQGELMNIRRLLDEASTDALPLRDAIRCEDYRRELEKMRTTACSPQEIAAKEREIAARVFGFVSRYMLHADSSGQTQSYLRAFPRVIRENQTVSCFGGPWLVASLLLECGIRYENLLYCDVHRTASGTIGSHGALVMGTEMKELMLIDTGYNIASATMRLGWCDAATQQKMTDLLKQRSSDAVKVTWQDGMDTQTGMHSDMYCMPLRKGITSIYLFNLGIAFLQEGKMAEARHTFGLSLSFNPKNPDVLYYRGLCCFHEGDLDTAKTYFEQAVKEFGQHMQSHFSLGEIALRQGNFFEAKERFGTVATCKDPVWGDQKFRALAQEYSRHSPVELATMWQDIARRGAENS